MYLDTHTQKYENYNSGPKKMARHIFLQSYFKKLDLDHTGNKNNQKRSFSYRSTLGHTWHIRFYDLTIKHSILTTLSNRTIVPQFPSIHV